ncbi:hypothetical protein WJX82_004584 [Trebouxia sp. C0006]
MSRPGLLRSLRDLFREFRNFGNPELENLKVHALRLQQELDELEARRAAREAQEEALALMQAQHTVHSLKQMEQIVQQSEKVIAAAVEKAGAQTDQQIKALLQQKAEEVMSKIDLSKALSLGGSPEEAVKHAMEEASAQLQAEGANFRLAQAEPQAPPSSNMQSTQPASSPVQEQLVPICRIWSTSRGQATFNVQHTINMTVRGHDSMERGSFSHLYIVN